jgi:hypothetical protein
MRRQNEVPVTYVTGTLKILYPVRRVHMLTLIENRGGIELVWQSIFRQHRSVAAANGFVFENMVQRATSSLVRLFAGGIAVH